LRKTVTARRPPGFFYVFGAPILLAVASTFGLVSALLGDGVWDLLSWFALGGPFVVILWYTARPASTREHRAATRSKRR